MAAAPLFDAAALTLFFEDPSSMGLSNRTRLQLAHVGTVVPEDFKEFDKEGLSAIFLNLYKPPKVTVVRAAAIAAGRLREILAFEVSAKSKMRLKGAMLIAKFYDNVSHPLDPDNMSWIVIKRFLEQWKALMEQKKADHRPPPKLTKNQPVHKWVDLFILYLSQTVGVRNAPLDYIVRAIAAVDATPPPCQLGDPHSIKTGSIDGDLTAHMPHNHPLYKVDNGSVFDMIESTINGHNVAATIAPFRRKWDGRGALIALQSQHAGKAIYDQLMKEVENVLKNRQWSGTTSMTLSQHIGLHWKTFITLSECAEHIPVEVPNDCARVTYLLDLFTTIDPSVLAAIAAVCQDDANKRVNFENAFTFLAPTCPITEKAAKKGRVLFDANISSTNVKVQGSLGGDCNNPGKGRTGIALCYHKYAKFQALSVEQKAELNEWKEANGHSKDDKHKRGVKKGGGKRSPGFSPCNATNATKRWKSMISKIEAHQTKIYEAMADVQATSIAAIQATSTGATPFQRVTDPQVTTIGAMASIAAVAPEVMVKQANVAMMKLTRILKSKEKKA
jgi:hypothetical protein